MQASQQAALVELGQSALAGTDIPSLMQQAVALVAHTLGVEYSAVLEPLPDGSALVLRAGVGWEEGAVGQATIDVERTALANYLLSSTSSVIVEDWRSETRFSQPPLLHDHEVICGVWVSILRQGRPFSILGADSALGRTFTDDDTYFLQAVANLLALAIERMQVEESLRASEERFRRLAENAADMIYRYQFAPTPGFNYVSPAAATITGYMPADYYVDPALPLRLAHPDDRPLFESHIQSPATNSEPFTMRLTHKDGSLIWTEQRVVPLLDAAGNLVAIEGIVRDITKRKRLEAELAEVRRRLAESRETTRLFLARELHDSAVQQLIGMSYQFAESGRLANDQRRPVSLRLAELAAALTAGRNAILSVVRQIRSLIGELRPAGLEEFGLTTALQGYVAHLEREVGPHQAEISLDLVQTGTMLPRLVAIGLFRVAQEAVRNALKHAAARHIYLSLSQSPDAIVLRVRDDGRGFQVPARLSELAQDDHFGLIGMAEWVNWVDGQLTVHSRPGAGTDIMVRIPLLPPASATRRTAHAAEGAWPDPRP
jgi:PAS domain S-box-containing protein